MSELPAQPCTQRCVCDFKPVSAEPCKLRHCQAAQSSRKCRRLFDVLLAQVVSHRGRLSNC